MEETLLRILIVAYGATSIVNLFGYWPTIKDLYYYKKSSANVLSYILWTSTGIIGFLYSIFIIPDLLLQIVFGLNFGACLIILILSLRLKNYQ